MLPALVPSGAPTVSALPASVAPLGDLAALHAGRVAHRPLARLAAEQRQQWRIQRAQQREVQHTAVAVRQQALAQHQAAKVQRQAALAERRAAKEQRLAQQRAEHPGAPTIKAHAIAPPILSPNAPPLQAAPLAPPPRPLTPEQIAHRQQMRELRQQRQQHMREFSQKRPEQDEAVDRAKPDGIGDSGLGQGPKPPKPLHPKPPKPPQPPKLPRPPPMRMRRF